MAEFKIFANQVHDNFVKLSKGELYVTVDGDTVWDTYLKAFPEGTNPIYLTRTEHDCSCCRNFIRNIGNVVGIVNGKKVSVWDNVKLPYPYDVVASHLARVTTAAEITNLFRTSEGAFGNQQTRQLLEGGAVKQWNHFYGAVSASHRTNSADQQRGDYRTTVELFIRGLTQLTTDALDTVQELIQAKSLYRGEEHASAVKAFALAKAKYDKLEHPAAKNIYVWEHAKQMHISRFRNTVIGTLVQDLSEGVELDNAVGMFESKVAPTNYKRSSALITKSMATNAAKKLEELGLTSALHRRFAKFTDISVNNVLWVNNATKAVMADAVTSLIGDLISTPPKSLAKNKPVKIGINEFMTTVLPNATDIEVNVQSQDAAKLVSITAPEREGNNLFKWNNNFAWSYAGEVTDSIKEKVKSKGGNVENAALRISLEWYNYDDLDLHVTPPNRSKIFFANRQGYLDVDENAGSGKTREPVENVSFPANKLLANGEYLVHVNNYQRRETNDSGFTIQIEHAGGVEYFTQQVSPQSSTGIDVCRITVENHKVTKIVAERGIASTVKSKELWGIKTNQFTKVNSVMYSPNYWDNNAVGNKHWFFILENCKNPEPTRGFYNEFLKNELTEHRKVFEVLSSRTLCSVTPDQLSGVGYSSTGGGTLLAKVSGNKMNTLYEIQF